MSPRSSAPTVRRGPVEGAIRAAGPFTPACDYEVAFTVDRPAGDSGTPEAWMRLIFEGAPRPLRWFMVSGWVLLTCRLERGRGKGQILGWPIRQRGDHSITDMVETRIGLDSYLVVGVDAGSITLATLVRYTTRPRLARAIWALVIPLHEVILRTVVRRAARNAAART
jgi:hypothetical protein